MDAAMSNSKTNSRAVGLDLSLGVIRWLTGHENLHYGLWDGLEVTAENLGRAQIECQGPGGHTASAHVQEEQSRWKGKKRYKPKTVL